MLPGWAATTLAVWLAALATEAAMPRETAIGLAVAAAQLVAVVPMAASVWAVSVETPALRHWMRPQWTQKMAPKARSWRTQAKTDLVWGQMT